MQIANSNTDGALSVKVHRVVIVGGGFGGLHAARGLRKAPVEVTLVDARAEDRHGHPVEGIRLANLADQDLEAHRDLFRGIDTVVHLAYVHPATGQGSGTVASYRAEAMNVDMAYLVYQLALEDGVRRVVVASSNHAGAAPIRYRSGLPRAAAISSPSSAIAL